MKPSIALLLAAVLMVASHNVPAWNTYDGGLYGSQLPIKSRANIFGGRDYYQGGRRLGSTRSNILNGRDFYDGSGIKRGYSRGNILGGEDFHWDRY